MRGHLEGLQGVDVQRVVDPARQRRAHAGHGPEEPLGVERAPQPLELRPAAGAQHLRDGGRDPRTDTGQRVEPLDAATLVVLPQVIRAGRHRVGRLAVSADPERVGSLLLEEVGGLAQALRDDLVRGAHARVAAPRWASRTR